ncbi:inactive ubiquitin carboxyl-terminal hydrolase MINDY-4B isoform X2 [Bemisia tabaci]|uniref:inactive ubiquitin carboxyl-terminal hydrolase MINDY-4B isoform X2 n=1 Tax=Bemisia tabaci TaxID=7038 RepID=UPI0008F9CDD3|nr:PREDICTED: protein FAM188B2 isoform X2 [Bemisia tabaci]
MVEDMPERVDSYPIPTLPPPAQFKCRRLSEPRYFPKDRIMYARSQQRNFTKMPVTGGTPVTQEVAIAFRSIVFGTSVAPPRGEWLRTGFVFRDADKELAYGLKAPRNGCRGLLSVVQAYILKQLLFERKDFKKNEPVMQPEMLLRPSRGKQLEALWLAISDILWRIGEKTKAVVCLPQDQPYVSHSLNYFQDSVTEKLHIFEIANLEELQIFIKRYIHLFLEEPGPGALLLLYSAVATRGTKNVISDIMDEKGYLVTGAEEGSQSIIMLLLTGRATPYLHNGVVYVGDEEHYAIPQFGVLQRSEIGFLLFDEGVEEKAPGSRLKTPSLPIWVVCCLGHFGVIFNTNRELLRNYHAERRFELIYYTCGGSQCQLTVDTRHDGSSTQVSTSEDTASSSLANLEKLIHTKWQDAHIHWNGTSNFI